LIKENERLDDLQLKGLKIIQDPKKYCFTSDAVLLSSFAKAKKGEVVFDFCSGSGVIALLLYAKNEGIKKIYCVEIQQSLAEMSLRSIKLNGLENTICVLNAPVQKAHEIAGCGLADVVVCNPPYSKAASSIINGNDAIAVARHEIQINIKEIMQSAAKILKYKGRFYIVHQAERLSEIMYEMKNCRIEPKLLRIVSSRADKMPHLVLIEGVYGGSSGMRIEKPLYILDEKNEYTEEAKTIYNINQ
jgi:tRNA1Val (adenine37-N6)-methyltransferase